VTWAEAHLAPSDGSELDELAECADRAASSLRARRQVSPRVEVEERQGLTVHVDVEVRLPVPVEAVVGAVVGWVRGRR
jgi:hypothetical protein